MKRDSKTYKMVLTALMAALCYIAFTYLKIPIPTIAGDKTALHVGNAFCILAALLIGGTYGGVAGSLGMTIADLMDPAYISSAPKTFILKFCIGFIAGTVAHKFGHISKTDKKSDLIFWSTMASIAGLGFNVIMDPIVGYLYKRYLLKVEASAAKIMATYAAGTTLINAIVSTILIVILYAALRPVLIKSRLFIKVK